MKEPGTKTIMSLAARWVLPDMLTTITSHPKWQQNIDTQDKFGWTALHHSVHHLWLKFDSEGADECIKILLNAGADPNKPDLQGHTPYQFVMESTSDAHKVLRFLPPPPPLWYRIGTSLRVFSWRHTCACTRQIYPRHTLT